jgi:hypothetical protein
MFDRLTDNARLAMRTAFPRGRPATELDFVTALTQVRGGAGWLQLIGIAVDRLPANTAQVTRRALGSQAVEVARQQGCPYVDIDHLLMALASLPGSGLPAIGVSADRISELVAAARAQWCREHPPLARRLGAWCRSVLLWFHR